MQRPNFQNIQTGEEFNQWYWLKTEMVDICKQAKLPHTGSKFELRDRIMYALDNDGKVLKQPKKTRKTSKFNWAKAELTLNTRITDNISFGPNFRRFMQSQINQKFSCHGDFMNWVKANVGKTLQDAILKWLDFENRKQNSNFKRDIAKHNMMSQYVRDFLANNDGYSFKEVIEIWKIKKTLPMKNGLVKYESSDLKLKP